MNPKLKLNILLLVLLSLPALARAQGTAFSYQGHLVGNGAAANGGYDFNFVLFGSAAGVDQIGPAVPLNNVPVANGQFNVTLDFGAVAFTGAARWLEISVRPAGVGQFTMMAGRVSLLPTPYAIFAATAGSVPNATVTANQLNTGGLAPAPGQFLSYNGGNLVWSDPAVAAGSVWSLNGASAYYTAGSVGIGTANPTPGVQLEVNGTTRITPGGSGGFVSIGTPSGETGLGVIGSSRFDLRFNGATLKLVAGYGLGPPPAQYGITINTNGNVGVGMADPLNASQWKLEVNGPTRITPGGSGGAIQFSTPNGETGMGFLGANRADIRFDGTTLKLLAVTGNSSPSVANGITINTSGNVGIGTDSAQAKLDVRGTTRTCVLTITGGCDLAEPFPMDLSGAPEGSVVVIDEEHPGRVKPSDRAYDTRVAGILSGANGIHPGISLQQQGELEGGQNVALSGRVYVRADAAYGVIKPGDLLTTSQTPGHAMKVTDHRKAQGAILGKAMSSLHEGQGMVLVLVTLQ